MNRKAVICVIILMLMALQISSLPQTNANPSTKVERMVYITDWGVTVVNDTITVDAATALPSSMRFGTPANLAAQLCYFSAKDRMGAIPVSKIIDSAHDTVWLEYSLSPRSHEAYTFYALTVFSDCVKASNTGGGFTFKFTQAPIMEQSVDLYNVTVILPKDAQIHMGANSSFTVKQYQNGPALRAVFKPFEAMTRKELSFGFTSITVQLFKTPASSRKINFASEGGIEVEDMYNMHNLGGEITSLTIRMPEGSKQIMAYDDLGSLWESAKDGDQVSVSPRYGSLKASQNFTFTLKYMLPANNLNQLNWWGKYNFTSNLLTPQPFIIDELDTEVILPQGSQIGTVVPQPEKTTKTAYETTYLFTLKEVTPFNDLTLTIQYTYLAFWSALKPLIWAAIVIAILLILAVTLKRRPTVKEVAAPFEALSKFVHLQDEKAALQQQLEDLEESLTRRTISKHEFRRRRHAVDQRLSAINREQQIIRGSFKDVNPHIIDLIQRLDQAEAEINAAGLSLANIRAQYRAGKISKETYLNMESDFTKQAERAKTTRDSLAITLKQELE